VSFRGSALQFPAGRADNGTGGPEPRAPSQGIDVEPVSTAQQHAVDDGGAGWTWPPYAPDPAPELGRFGLDEWAPASTVRHPWVRVGRFTLLYRRAA
jgi:hypothetical protein